MQNTKNCSKCGSLQTYSTISALNLAKRNNSVCRNCSTKSYAKRKGDLSLLESDSLLKYYWLGFIMADGSLRNNRLTIYISKKDENHLKILAKSLKLNIRYQNNNCGLSVMNKDIVSKLVKDYSINNNKTRNPCTIDHLNGDKLKALSIGFIDGDGSIDKQSGGRSGARIRVKCDISWFNNLKLMYGVAKVTSDGYALASLTKHKDCKDLKKFAIDKELPIMSRKWDNIDLSWQSKYELAEIRKNKVVDLKILGFKNGEIAKQLKISPSTVTTILKRIKNEFND